MAIPDRVGRVSHYDGDRGDLPLECWQRRSKGCNDDINLQSHELRSNFRNSLVAFRGAPLDGVILFIDVTMLTHALHERVVKTGNSRARCAGEKADAPHFSGLLRACRERPRSRRSSNSRNKIASSHCLPRALNHVNMSWSAGDQSRNLSPAKWGSMVCVRSSNPEPRMSLVGLGCAKTPAPAAHVETSRRNCAPWSRIVLRARCSIPCWRIVFSTFRNCMSFHTGWVIHVVSSAKSP